MRRFFFHPMSVLVPLASALVTLSACAGALEQAEQSNTPEALYQQALEDLDDGLYPEALDGFAQVKNKFPYSKYAALADLRTADTHYERGKFLEAIDAYRGFLKYHPTHEEAPYAMIRIADAYYEQMPENWFILPPAEEKDQASTRLAISAYRDMLTRYPKSEYAERAQQRLDEGRRRLADHEMYVAKFYFQRERFKASATRAEGLLREYAGLGLDAEALWIAGQSRFNAQEPALAREHLAKLVKEHAESSQANDARALLARVEQAAAAAKAGEQPTSREQQTAPQPPSAPATEEQSTPDNPSTTPEAPSQPPSQG